MTDLLAHCQDLPVRTVLPGDVLITAGSVIDEMYVLVSGSVTIESEGGVAFARIDNPGAIFGEMSVVLNRAATATVRAATDAQVRVVADPLGFMTDRPGVALEILRMTAARLDGLTHYVVDVKEQFADQDGHLGMVGQILDTLVHHQAAPTRTGSARDPDAG